MAHSYAIKLFKFNAASCCLIAIIFNAALMTACATTSKNQAPIASRGLIRIDQLTRAKFHNALISSMWHQANDRKRLELVRALYGDLDAEYSARVQTGMAPANTANEILRQAQERMASALREFPNPRFWVSKTIHGQQYKYDVQPSNTFVATETLYPNEELEYVAKRTSRFDKAVAERRLRVELAGMNAGPEYVYGPLGPNGSSLNVSFDSPTITFNIPVEKAKFQDALYQAVKKRETLRYTLIVDVEFDLSHCDPANCELRVSDSQIRNFHFGWSDQ